MRAAALLGWAPPRRRRFELWQRARRNANSGGRGDGRRRWSCRRRRRSQGPRCPLHDTFRETCLFSPVGVMKVALEIQDAGTSFTIRRGPSLDGPFEAMPAGRTPQTRSRGTRWPVPAVGGATPIFGSPASPLPSGCNPELADLFAAASVRRASVTRVTYYGVQRGGRNVGVAVFWDREGPRRQGELLDGAWEGAPVSAAGRPLTAWSWERA